MRICLAYIFPHSSLSVGESLVSGMSSSYIRISFIFLQKISLIQLYEIVFLQAYYLANSRELTRLGSITKSPVIHHFSETVSGVMTIRSFRRQTKFCKQNIDKVNTNLKMDFYTYGANEWLGFRLEFIGSVVLCFSALFMIILPSSIIKPGQITQNLNCT